MSHITANSASAWNLSVLQNLSSAYFWLAVIALLLVAVVVYSLKLSASLWFSGAKR